MKKLILTLIVLLNLSSLKAQTDTEFWFAAPEVTSRHADRPIYLIISTMDKPATVTISQPANSLLFTPIILNIRANNTQSIDLTPYIALLENDQPDTKENKGLLVKSTALITAYYEVLGKQGSTVLNSDLFSFKGKNALGTRFYTPFQNYFTNYPGINAWSSFDIVATEDGTLVTITPSRDVVGHSAGIPYTVNLNKGQTYSARATGLTGADHLCGSLITSNKPIAVTLKDDSLTDFNRSPFGWDLVGDQIIPVDVTGKEYIVIKASGSLNIDRAFICATEDATDIFIGGNTVATATLQQGQTYDFLLIGNYNYIQTSKPAYVFHVTGFGPEIGGALLPPINCTGSRQVGFVRPNDDQFVLNILVKTGGENSFVLNGSKTLVPASAFSVVPGTNGVWKAARISYSTSQIISNKPNLIKNDKANFHLGLLNGNNSLAFRYGYFSDFGALDLGPDKTICQGDSATFDGGSGMTSYLWNTTDTSEFITVKDSGQYWVDISKSGCALKRTRDSVNLFFYPSPEKVLGADTTVCSNVNFKIRMDTLYTSYTWQNGSKDSTFKPVVSGIYWVEAKNNFGCKTRDSITVTVNPAPRPVISFDPDLEKTCWESTITLDAGPGYVSYKWNDGSTNRKLITSHLPEYYVTVVDSNGCTDSTNLYIDCSPYVKVYNLITPNGDGSNDVFYVEGLKPGKWILEIFNRWGERVYYNRSYNNEFEGKDVVSGIYYYNLRHVEGKKVFKGWVQIIKD